MKEENIGFMKRYLSVPLTIGVLVIFSYYMFSKLYLTLRFDNWDETYYLSQAFDRIYNFSWSFLYAKVYALYLFFTNDLIFIYHLHTYLLSFVAVPLVVFLISYLLSKSKSLSLLFGMLALFSAFNIHIIPKIQLFNFVILSLLFILIVYSRNIVLYGLTLNLAFYSIYLRQDNLLIIPFFILFFFLHRHFKKISGWIILTGSLALLCYTVFYVRTPFDSFRSVNAFFDWFSWEGAAKRYGVSDTSLINIQQNVFKGAKTVRELFVNNFPAVKIHMLNNLEILISKIPEKKIDFIAFPLLQIFVFFTIILLAAVNGMKVKISRNYSKFFLLFYIFLVGKCLATILFLSAKEKYFLEVVLLFPIFIFALFNLFLCENKLVARIELKWISRLSVAVVILLASLFAIHEPTRQFDLTFKDIDGLKADLLKLNFAQIHPVYAHEISPIYFGNNTGVRNIFEFERYREQFPGKTFIDFLEDKKFKVLLLTRSMDFQDDYHKLGIKQSKKTVEEFLAEHACSAYRNEPDEKTVIYVCP